MKQTLSILFIFLNLFFSFCQQKGSISISWKNNKSLTYNNNTYILPQFDSENFHFDTYSKNINYVLKIKSNNNFDEKALQLSNLVFEPISEAQLGDLSIDEIPTTTKYSYKNIKSRGLYSGEITISPIIKENNIYKKLMSFTYSLDLKTSKQLIASNNIIPIQNSVLSTGNWHRFYVTQSGAYKITKNFLQSLGVDTNVDPRNIKIYGSGGKMTPLLNSEYYPMDLEENAIQVIGENDGIFNEQDYILFYAEGIDNWDEVNNTNLNLYSDKSYYYITTSNGNGKRMDTINQPTGSPTTNINTFNDYQFHEIDQVSIAKTGRQWFGEQFIINNSQDFNFNFPNLDPSKPVQISIHSAASAFNPTNFTIKANNQTIGSMSFNSISPGGGTYAYDRYFNGNFNSVSDNISINLKYNNNGVPLSNAYLNYININATRFLIGYNKQFPFQYDLADTTGGIGQYQFSNATSISQIWDITDLYNISKIENLSDPNFSFKVNLGEVRKYIAIDNNDLYTPLSDNPSKVVNQNLKGTIFNDGQNQFKDVDYLIITPQFLVNQAEKLAAFHRSHSNLNTKVVALENIYHEFSSGKQDIGAIRNFIKYVYWNASTPGITSVKYVNIFGDASYDFKDRIPNNTNIAPIYHALNSYTDGESSFCSDDFYVCMDENEGNTNNYFSGIDIAVGRMIVDNAQQADEMVNKVLEYHNENSFGDWHNNYVAIADDSDKPSDASLQQKQNDLTDKIVEEKPFINFKKILLDSYEQETSSGGSRYPKARIDLFSEFEKGALVFNYLGHGGEDGLTGERLWEKSDGQNLKNRYRYPLFITITCDFSKFDNPSRPTAGEYTYWNPSGGAISMITTVRSIGQYQAEIFNDKIAEYLFAYGSNDYTSIAEALRLAKNEGPNSATNVVFYLGDPALMLAIPKPKIVLTEVNDKPITETIDDFKSLGYIKLAGEVLDENNSLLINYNGTLTASIFDKNILRTTLNNNGYSPPIEFDTLGEKIFKGNVSVINGKFEFSFVVPKDIRINVGNGKVSFYSKDSESKINFEGYNRDIKIGGINSAAPSDNTPPTVKLYMNNETFVNGGITNNSPFLLALLEDENGINTAGGIGHDIVGILDGDENNPFIMNDYYETELNNYKKGKLSFPFKDLTIGLHTLTFKAWDVYNNPVTSEIQFVVSGNDSITLKNVLNYPNPFVNYTEFWFNHNKPNEPLDVQVQVMTITGKIVWTKNQTVVSDGFLSRDITWDGKDNFGDRIGKGVYVYKLTVKSTLSNKKAEKIEKLVIL